MDIIEIVGTVASFVIWFLLTVIFCIALGLDSASLSLTLFVSFCFLLLIIATLAEFSLDNPKINEKTGRLRVKKDSFPIRIIYYLNWTNNDNCKCLPGNICKLIHGLFIGIFISIIAIVVVTIVSVVLNFIQLAASFAGFLLGFVSRGSIIDDNLSFYPYQTCFETAEDGSSQERKFIAPWKIWAPFVALYLLVANIGVIFDTTSGTVSAINFELLSTITSFGALAIILSGLLFMVGCVVVEFIRDEDLLVVAREWLKGKKGGFCLNIEIIEAKEQ